MNKQEILLSGYHPHNEEIFEQLLKIINGSDKSPVITSHDRAMVAGFITILANNFIGEKLEPAIWEAVDLLIHLSKQG